MNFIKLESAIEGVKLLFSGTKTDKISIKEAMDAWGREGYTSKQNLGWLGNKMTHFKYHDLVRSVYGRRNGRRILKGLQLTLAGKHALGRVGSKDTTQDITPEVPTAGQHEPDFTKAMSLVAKLQKEYPEYKINFNIKLNKQA